MIAKIDCSAMQDCRRRSVAVKDVETLHLFANTVIVVFRRYGIPSKFKETCLEAMAVLNRSDL